jgi:O-antigen/teichoic acid export membrane protein
MGSFWVKRIAGFGALPLVGILSPLVTLPFLTRSAGPEGWASIAVAQALAGAAVLIVQFGWGTVGPPEVALASERDGRELYFTSVLMRSFLYVIVAPIGLLVLAALTSENWFLVSAVIFAATTLGGLSSGWYFIGRGLPTPLLLLEYLPRFAGAALSAIVLALFDSVELYAAITLIVEAFIAVAATLYVSRISHLRDHIRQARVQIRLQWHLGAAALISSGYTRLALPIVSLASPLSAPVYAAADRMQTLARSVVRPLVQSLQEWVNSSTHNYREFRRRFWIASAPVVIVGFLGALALLALLPLVDIFFFGPEIPIDSSVAALVGGIVLCYCLSSCTSTFCLAPLRKFATISSSTAVGSIVGAPLVLVGATLGGVTGALLSVLIAELVVFGWQAVVCLAWLRTEDPQSDGAV